MLRAADGDTPSLPKRRRRSAAVVTEKGLSNLNGYAVR